jgi:hypothetical protein
LLLARLSVAASTLFIKRASGMSSLLLNRDGMWIGAAMLGACAFVLEEPLQVVWTPSALLSLLLMGTMLGGEPLGARTVLGAALVLSGIGLAMR